MIENSFFVSSIDKLCKARSAKCPQLKIDGSSFGEDSYVENYYDVLDPFEEEKLFATNPSKAELNDSLWLSCDYGDIYITEILLKRGADPNTILDSKFFYLDYKNVSIVVELIKRTDYESFYRDINNNLGKNSKQEEFYLALIGELFMVYANIRKQEVECFGNTPNFQSYKKQRADLVFLLSLIKEGKPNPLPNLRIPGDFTFVSPLSLHEMLKDHGDEIDSKFARCVLSLTDPDNPMFEY